MFAKIAAVNNPLVIGGGGVAGIEVAEAIPHEAIKLVCQVVIAVATLVKFFKDRKKNQ
jgi:NADH dehydrogenase FAD-containing subunit